MSANKKIAVRYYTKTGNTKKLAEAIAETVGVKAESVTVPVDQEVDILFLGSSDHLSVGVILMNTLHH